MKQRVQSTECRGEVRGPGKGKTIENLVYQTKYGAGVGEQPCVGGQSGWLLTWAADMG